MIATAVDTIKMVSIENFKCFCRDEGQERFEPTEEKCSFSCVLCVCVSKPKKRKTKANSGKEGKLSKERKGKRGQLWTTKVQLANSGHQGRRN